MNNFDSFLNNYKKKYSFAFRITLIYIVLGVLWILFSDRFMFLLFKDTHTLNLVSTYKGWFYVLFTGWLLFLLVRREMKKRNAIEKQLIESRKKAEESEKLKTAFLNNISHEIRTPLNAIIGFSDLMVNPDLNEEQRRSFSGFIKRGTTDLVDTIEDILIISRIQTGQIQLFENIGDVVSLLEEMQEYFIAQMKNQKGKSDIPLLFEHSLELDQRMVLIDFRHLKQVLNKLIGNAIKFTDEGSILIRCDLKSDNEILFSVRDTGCGIPEVKKSVVFSPFRQADETVLSRKTGGSGLGLSIAKGLVELMGGKIWFESSEGKGSIFSFTIPFQTAGKF